MALFINMVLGRANDWFIFLSLRIHNLLPMILRFPATVKKLTCHSSCIVMPLGADLHVGFR